MRKLVELLIPATQWLSSYNRSLLRSDMSAGLTTAVMLVPQAMAYALLAGLPPTVGLYASIVPLMVYALFGTSRQLAVGPVAIVSLMTAASIGMLAEAGDQNYIAYAVLLAGMVGAIQFFMGVFRFGFLVNFLSHPVVSGFTSAAALVIGLSQLKHLLGLDLPRSHHIHEIIMSALNQFADIHLLTLIIGLVSMAALLLLKKWKPLFPSALIVVAISTTVVWLFGLDQQGVKIVGAVPAGLPMPALPQFDMEIARSLLPAALAISFVGFMESISVAKAFARKNKYDISPNQELIGLGLANLASSVFKGYPVTGGFSRTAVNAQAGAKTGMAAIVTALVIGLVLIFMTPLFYYLPKAVLAAIIMMAIVTLIDLKEVKHLYQVKRSDLALLGVTFVATLTLGIEQGILTGVVVSLLSFVVSTTRPHSAILGRLPSTDVYRNIKRHSAAKTIDDVIIVRIDAQFYFGNATFLKDYICTLIKNAEEKPKALIIHAGSVTQLDSSADTVLHEIVDELSQKGIVIYIAEAIGPVLDVMKRSGLYEKIGETHFTWTVQHALDDIGAHR